jgi:hypothetical protein
MPYLTANAISSRFPFSLANQVFVLLAVSQHFRFGQNGVDMQCFGMHRRFQLRYQGVWQYVAAVRFSRSNKKET